MARTRVRTLLPLDTWVKIIGIDPRHFNQVTTNAKASTSCTTVWKQHAWQESNQVGREDVAIAIAQAEQLIAEHVGYRLLPTWEVDERQRVTPPGIPDVFNVRLEDPRQFPMSVKTDYGHLISGGIEGKTLIVADAPVTFEDLDGDGFCETATVQVTTTLTDPTEIAVYFPGEDGRDDWEIRPLHNPRTGRRDVTITAGIATIVMATEQLVDPDLWEALDPSDVDGAVLSNFTATVDVYRHFNDPQTQVTLLWAPRGGTNCDCGSESCVICAHEVQTGCLVAKDFRRGRWFFQPGVFNVTTQAFDSRSPAVRRNPNIVRLFYYAGFQNQQQDEPRLEMDPAWARAVTYFSLTLLTRPLCGCDNVQGLARRMTEDVALEIATGDTSTSYQLGDRILETPWGTMRGAIYAWQLANSQGRPIGQAVAL